MLIELLEQENMSPYFRVQSEVRGLLQKACNDASHVAEFICIGKSEEGRDVDAMIMGAGPKKISLMAGAHADEPVGPETLRFLVTAFSGRHNESSFIQELLEQFTFLILPQINPDGEARNRDWASRWPDYATCFEHQRELPGRDIEFGYPAMRVENKLVHKILKEYAPFDLHMSLHGMSVAEGCMLLIERHWIDRTVSLRKAWREYVASLGLGLHDHNRHGEKGFIYIEPGFTTTPEGSAMRAHFESLKENQTANLFHDSSMEAIRKMGGDPLCLVTEVPLYVINDSDKLHQPGVPAKYIAYRKMKEKWSLKASRGEVPVQAMRDYGLAPVPLLDAMKMQLRAMELGLQLI